MIAFVGVPLLEIWTVLQVGKLIGAWWTLLLLVVDSVVGAWLVKREGLRAWRSLQETLAGGRMPAGAMIDGALILIGGTLMLTPGFVTDAMGAFLIVPLTRPLARRLLVRWAERGLPGSGGGAGGNPHRPGPPAGGPVVQGDVVD